MIRLQPLNRVYTRRTIRPMYGQHQAAPFAATLSVNCTDEIFPGMVAWDEGGRVEPSMNVCRDGLPFGLFANFINGKMDELGGTTRVGIWTSGIFEALPGAFAEGVDWNQYALGTAIGNDLDGKLVPLPNRGSRYKVGNFLEAYNGGKSVVLDLQIEPIVSSEGPWFSHASGIVGSIREEGLAEINGFLQPEELDAIADEAYDTYGTPLVWSRHPLEDWVFRFEPIEPVSTQD